MFKEKPFGFWKNIFFFNFVRTQLCDLCVRTLCVRLLAQVRTHNTHIVRSVRTHNTHSTHTVRKQITHVRTHGTFLLSLKFKI